MVDCVPGGGVAFEDLDSARWLEVLGQPVLDREGEVRAYLSDAAVSARRFVSMLLWNRVTMPSCPCPRGALFFNGASLEFHRPFFTPEPGLGTVGPSGDTFSAHASGSVHVDFLAMGESLEVVSPSKCMLSLKWEL